MPCAPQGCLTCPLCPMCPACPMCCTSGQPLAWGAGTLQVCGPQVSVAPMTRCGACSDGALASWLLPKHLVSGLPCQRVHPRPSFPAVTLCVDMGGLCQCICSAAYARSLQSTSAPMRPHAPMLVTRPPALTLCAHLVTHLRTAWALMGWWCWKSRPALGYCGPEPCQHVATHHRR